MALLRYVAAGQLGSGTIASITGLRPDLQRRFEQFSAEDYERFRPKPSPRPHMAEEVGIATDAVLRDLHEQVSFVGSVTAGLVVAFSQPKRMRWNEVKRVFELAGANALPIVALISLLVGLIIAFQSAQPLAQFGAQVYIANMIGLMMVRELSPLMTAIMLAGRSGSAFAAELGTMKVNEELNALTTMGLDPIRFLVIQRIMAGLLLTPLLTLYSMLAGILGGVLVMLSLGFPLSLIYVQLVSSLTINDVLLGVIKGAVFGVLVAAVGCLRGLQTRQGPSAVGQSTTRAVVSSILLIILADAVFSVVTFVLNI
jgi:phospholipid/cholesterol/gamma-HCH transport system permease protein